MHVLNVNTCVKLDIADDQRACGSSRPSELPPQPHIERASLSTCQYKKCVTECFNAAIHYNENKYFAENVYRLSIKSKTINRAKQEEQAREFSECLAIA